MPTDSPLVSIIIPTFNRAYIVAQAIESVLAQTYKNIQIVIVDDGSSDKTDELIAGRYAGRVTYVFQHNRGLSAARNLGFRLAKGAFIGYLDSDDYFSPESVEVKIQYLLNHPEIHWVYSDQKYIDEEHQIVRETRYPKKLKEQMEHATDLFGLFFKSEITLVSPNTALLKRECIEAIGGFDEEHTGCLEEHDFFLRLARRFQGQFIPRVLSIQTRQPGSISTDRETTYRARAMLVEMIRKKFPEEIRRYHWPPRFSRWRADIHNYFGMKHLVAKERKRAREEFLKSIHACPLQGRVYLQFVRTFFHPSSCAKD